MAASTSGDGMEGAAELDPYTSCDDELGEVLVLDEASDEELAEALQLSLSAGRGAPRATGGGRGFWCGDVAVAEDGDGPTARGLGQELRPAAAEGLEQELRRPVLDQRMEAGRRRGAWGSSFGRRRWRAWSRSSCGRRRKGWSSSSGGQQWMAWSNSSRGN